MRQLLQQDVNEVIAEAMLLANLGRAGRRDERPGWLTICVPADRKTESAVERIVILRVRLDDVIKLAAKWNDAVSGQPDAAVLVSTVQLFARLQVRPAETRPGWKSVAEMFSLALARAAAAKALRARRMVMPSDPDAVTLLDAMAGTLRLAEPTPELKAAAHALCGLPPTSETTVPVRRRIFISTPLACVPSDEHRGLMRLVDRVVRPLSKLGYVVIIPDPRLTPESNDEGHRLGIHLRERALVAGCDAVICLGGEYESYGASKVITWAEAALAPVLVLADNAPTRVLNTSPHRTTADPVPGPVSPVDVLTWLSGGIEPVLARKVAQRCRVAVGIGPLLRLARKTLDLVDAAVFGEHLLTQERAASMLDDPMLFAVSSDIELVALEDLIGDVVSKLRAWGRDADVEPRGTEGDAARQGLIQESGPRLPPRWLAWRDIEGLDAAATLNAWDAEQALALALAWLTRPMPAGFKSRTVGSMAADDWKYLWGKWFESGAGPDFREGR
jgi:hypothetical protein